MSPASPLPALFRTLCTCAILLLPAFAAHGNPLITELMADNKSVIADEDGDYSDWIEIHNPGAIAVNLANWSLTDDRTNLPKWQFPAVTLQPGDFLVVWASAKNRRIPGQPLHTNFSLSKSGEYLALVQPDGATIEQQFDPFPALAADESYGLQFTTTTYVAAGASARYLVPSSDALGTTWTTPAFNANTPTNWSTGPTGLGFGLLVPGIAVRDVLANGTVNNLTDTDNLLALPKGDPGILGENTVIAPTVNFLDDGSDGHYGANQVFPAGGGQNHCIIATGTIQIPTTGQWTFGINSADGGRIKIDGTAVVTDGTAHGPADHLGSRFISTKGAHTFELVMWNTTGDGEVEFYAAPGLITLGWSTAFKLVGDTANGGLAVATLQIGVGSNIAATDLTTPMQNVNSSCYTRLPFTGTGPGAFTAMQLKMRYNDGYVAYLNGTKIASRNAPASPVYNSTANAARTILDAVVVEPVNVSPFVQQLVNGSNVLAIQGLNVSAADSSFLLLPELIAGGVNTGVQAVFFDATKATPGGINGPYSLLGKVEDTSFSVKRGFHTAPFQLTITTPTPGATVRYTTDRSTPTETNGTVYSGPITIGSTTVIRAAAFKTGYLTTNVDTQTYIFTSDVVTQSPGGAPFPGWPGGPINGQILDYGMDPDIVNSGNPAIGGPAVVQAALQAISSISIVTDQKNLTDATTGIYVHPASRGFAWERASSIEMINPPDATHPNGTDEFHVNAGIRVRGGYSRDTANPKHGFHLFFRSDYGDSKLNYPLFGHAGTASFDQIDLRTAENYSWSYGGDVNNTFLREEATRLAQTDMGQLGSHVRYVHLYLNGQYFGLYVFDERTEASFGASYLPGSKEDFDVVKCEQDSGYTTGLTDGNFAAWQNLWTQSRAHYFAPTNANFYKMQGLAADGVTPTSDPVLLDVDNLIDYMLDTFWPGNLDGATSAFLSNDRANNWFGSRNRNGKLGFKFFTHDAEHTFFSPTEDRTGPFGNPSSGNWNNFTYSNPMFLHQDLMPNAEYKIRWADHVQKRMFNGGQMSPSAWTARFNKLAAIVDKVIVAESARWGDSKVSTPLNRQNWQAARDYILNSYIPVRGTQVLAQLRGDGLYPSIDAPTLTPFGGYVAGGSQVVMSTPAGTIYYMADGSDPRLLGGGVKPGAQTYISAGATAYNLSGAGVHHLRVRTYNGGTWSALDDATYLVDTDAASSTNLAVSEIMYHPADPTAAEVAAGFTNADDFEFIEFLNIGPRMVDLDGLYFYGGIDFDFANSLIGRTLPVGGRFILVANKAAFEARYGTGRPVAGEYSGQLNNAGEEITLFNSADAAISDVTYGTFGAWPAGADGGGYSLVRINPDGNQANDNNPAKWQLSTTVGGSPGTSDLMTFASWKIANNIPGYDSQDTDGDGLNNIFEYALGGGVPNSDTQRLPRVGTASFPVGGVTNPYATFTFTRRSAVSDVTFIVETNNSLNPATWTANGVFVSATANGDGTETAVYRSPNPQLAGGPMLFLRLKTQVAQ